MRQKLRLVLWPFRSRSKQRDLYCCISRYKSDAGGGKIVTASKKNPKLKIYGYQVRMDNSWIGEKLNTEIADFFSIYSNSCNQVIFCMSQNNHLNIY